MNAIAKPADPNDTIPAPPPSGATGGVPFIVQVEDSATSGAMVIDLTELDFDMEDGQ